MSCLIVGKLLTFTNMAVRANGKLKQQHMLLVIQISQQHKVYTRNVTIALSSVVELGLKLYMLLDVPIFTSWMFSTCVMKLKAMVRFSSF